MNKTALGVTGGMILLVVFGYFLFQINSEKRISSNDLDKTSEEVKEEIFTGNVYDLSRRGGDYECTLEMTGEFETTAHIYVSDRDIRGEFSSNIEGIGNIDVAMIVDDTNVYSWNSLAPDGYVALRIEDQKEVEENLEESDSIELDYDQDFDYTCRKWERDGSVFVLPGDIKFEEIILNSEGQ